MPLLLVFEIVVFAVAMVYRIVEVGILRALSSLRPASPARASAIRCASSTLASSINAAQESLANARRVP